jgi:hypothetical protein
MHNDNANTDVVFDAIKVEYKQMASWYDKFWHSYTLGMCVVIEREKKRTYVAVARMSFSSPPK